MSKKWIVLLMMLLLLSSVYSLSFNQIFGFFYPQNCQEFCQEEADGLGVGSFIANCDDHLYPSDYYRGNPEYTNWRCGNGPYDDSCYKRERFAYTAIVECEGKLYCNCYTCEEVNRQYCCDFSGEICGESVCGGNWLNSGEENVGEYEGTDEKGCCGDDEGEYTNFPHGYDNQTGSYFEYQEPFDYYNVCCNGEWDCVGHGNCCYDNGTFWDEGDYTGCVVDGLDFPSGDGWVCHGGEWYDQDYNPYNLREGSFCKLEKGNRVAKAGESFVGEYEDQVTYECCGDDEGEYPVNQGCNSITDYVCCDDPDDKVLNGKCVSYCPQITTSTTPGVTTTRALDTVTTTSTRFVTTTNPQLPPQVTTTQKIVPGVTTTLSIPTTPGALVTTTKSPLPTTQGPVVTPTKPWEPTLTPSPTKPWDEPIPRTTTTSRIPERDLCSIHDSCYSCLSKSNCVWDVSDDSCKRNLNLLNILYGRYKSDVNECTEIPSTPERTLQPTVRPPQKTTLPSPDIPDRGPRQYEDCILCVEEGYQWRETDDGGECCNNCESGVINLLRSLFYDVNCITEEDRCLQGSGEGDLTTANPILPSVTGIGVNKFSGSSSVSYSIQVPPAAGIIPSLSLTYNSRNVDDAHKGLRDWYKDYYHQASWVGLGWNLDGLGYIVRDPSSDYDNTLEDTKDDRFYLVFPGGSAELVDVDREDDYCNPAEWRTSPELFLKIEHNHFPCAKINDQVSIDSSPWIVTTKDGTRYYFGNPISGDGRFCVDENCRQVFGTSEESTGLDIKNSGNLGDVILNKDVNGNHIGDPSLSTEYGIAKLVGANGETIASRMLPQKWYLRKIEDVHGNKIEIKYEARVKETVRKGSSNWCPQEGSDPWCPNFYTHDVRPVEVIYGSGKNGVKFLWEDRDDYKISDWDSENKVNYFTKKRLDSIEVKTDGQLVRRYDLSYDKAYKCKIEGKTTDDFHTLLESIKVYGKDGSSSLPAYKFNYFNKCPSKNYEYTGGSNYYEFSFNTALLKSVDNGYGGGVEFTYEFTNPLVCKSECNSGEICCSENKDKYGSYRARVTTKTVKDGMGNSYQISYGYGDDGKVYVENLHDYLPGYRFLGYGNVDEILHRMGSGIRSKTTTYYHDVVHEGWSLEEEDHDYKCFKPDPRSGQSYRTEFRDSTGDIVQYSESTILPDVDCQSLDEHASHFIRPAEKVEWIEGDQTKLEYSWDETYGNLLRTFNHGDLSVVGDEKSTVAEYTMNLDKWIIGTPKVTKVYNHRNVLNQETKNYYDGHSDPNSPPDRGLVTKTCSGLGGDLLCAKISYDRYGNPEKTWDAMADVSEHYTIFTDYDDKYNIYPVRTCNALDQCTEAEYDYILGKPVWTEDLNGHRTYYIYDSFGQLEKVAFPGDQVNLDGDGKPVSIPNPSLEYSYYYPGSRNQFDWNGNPKLVVITESKIDGSRKLETRQIYNGLGQMIQTQTTRVEVEERGGISMKDVVSSVKYNELGSESQATLPYAVDSFQGRGHPYIHQFGDQMVSYEYDSLGRVTRTTDPMGRTSLVEYSGWTSKTTDAEGHSTKTVNDAYGRVKETYLYGNDGRLYRSSWNQYDVLGNLLQSSFIGYLNSDGTPLRQSFANINMYDAHGRRIWQDDVDLGVIEYVYDKNGNLVNTKDNKGNVIEFTYDSLDRLEKKIYPDGSEVVYYYDGRKPVGCPAVENGLGRTGGMSDSTGYECYSYDNRGRMVRFVKDIHGEKAEFKYVYYDNDAVKITEYPDGETLTNVLDDTGRIKEVKSSLGNTFLSGITYDVQGNPKKVSYGNDVMTQYSYDITGWMTGVYTHGPSSALINRDYWRDDIGNIEMIYDNIRVTEPGTGCIVKYEYDPIGRLTLAEEDCKEGCTENCYETVGSYAYDSLDRMVRKNEGGLVVMEYTNPDHLHAPSVVGGNELRYDANGNAEVLYNHERVSVEWDYDDKPVKMTRGGIVTEFEYDGSGNRVRKKVV